jgi:2-polyprenyl-3-methyl-5-hydroxy-6-metoxy-1,4-benzoquinol methylase
MQKPNNKLTEAEFWNNSYKNIDFSIVSKDNELRKIIESSVARTKNKSFLELGCYPGKYLAIFAELGYEVNGIDWADGVTDLLPDWLRKQKYRCGDFEQSDIFDYTSVRKFDIVGSFGLIEHFTNWSEMIELQANLVADSGYIVLETPNFKGVVQNTLHKFLDRRNFDIHFIPSMSPEKWSEILINKGFKIIDSGYKGKFDFWVDTQERNFIQKLCLKIVLTLTPLLSMLLPEDKKSYSPYCWLVAKKI